MTHYWPFSGILRHGALRERLIVALDNIDRREALGLVERLARSVGMFKVGRSLFVGSGTELIREIRKRGAEVFLDLRFHDTPQKVLRAAMEATRLGVKMFDLHPQGSVELMGRVKTEIGRLCRSEGLRRPHILAVAMLAGLPASDGGHAGNGVVRLAQRAADASLDGVFTVAHEVARVRAACGRRFIIVTSGVRPRAPREPGEKCLTAADAIRAGADYIVVGSAVLRAAEPAAAARELTEDIERGLRAAPRSPLELVPSRSL